MFAITKYLITSIRCISDKPYLWQAFHANNHYLRISEIHLRIS